MAIAQESNLTASALDLETLLHPAPHGFILTGAPTAFQPEWPTVM